MHLADLVEEDGSLVGELELPRLLAGRAGERAALVAEELAFEELAGKGCAVDLDERFPAPNAALVESAGDALLADAALAADEDGNVGLRDAVDHVPDAEHRRAHRDELARGPSPQRGRSHRRRSGIADDDRRRFGPRGCGADRILGSPRGGAATI